MIRVSLHVILDPDGGWVVKKYGAKRALKHFENRQGAIIWGSTLARDHRVELIIHKADGTVDEKRNGRYA